MLLRTFEYVVFVNLTVVSVPWGPRCPNKLNVTRVGGMSLWEAVNRNEDVDVAYVATKKRANAGPFLFRQYTDSRRDRMDDTSTLSIAAPMLSLIRMDTLHS